MAVDPELADCYPNTVGHRVFSAGGRSNEGSLAAAVPRQCKIVHEQKKIETDDEVTLISETAIYFPVEVDANVQDVFVLPAPFTPAETQTLAVEQHTDFSPDIHHTVVRV